MRRAVEGVDKCEGLKRSGVCMRLWCGDYAAGGRRHAAGFFKLLRFGESCGRSDDAAEVTLQRLC